jgi:hypothetical protein
MVIAEKWAEQRVLMRSYAESRDQTRPTIFLHGEELAIGPAGLDVNGPWGIHVSTGAEGHAQALASMLEESARRVAGSKGSPPRLQDESQTFDREPTGNWTPGAPAMTPGHRPGRSRRPTGSEPAEHLGQMATRVPQAPSAVPVAPSAPAHRYAAVSAPPHMVAPSNPDQRRTPVPMRKHVMPAPNERTSLGFQSGAGAQSAIVRLGLAPAVSARMHYLAERVVPADFQVSKIEREVLNAIGLQGGMTARAIGNLVHVADPVSWMEHFIRKLEEYGLELIEPGEASGGEPTYHLR